MKTWFWKRTFCKATLATAVACLALGAVSTAHAAACSNASLKGKYGQTISGQILPGPGMVAPQNGVAMTTFNGNGKFTQEDFVVIGGSPTSTGFAKETGTYEIKADCTGTATINYTDAAWIDLELIVVNEGSEFYTVVSVLNMGGGAVPANIGSHGVRVSNVDKRVEDLK